MRNAKHWRRFWAFFTDQFRRIILLDKFLTWRPRLPLLPEFSGTSAGVPNRSHGNAATACHSVSGVDFARRGRQYFTRELFPMVENLI
jgi:hypothetical protein